MKDGELSRRMFLGAGGAFALLNGGCAFRAPAGLFGGGAVVLAGNIPEGWNVRVRANSLVLKKLGGMVITIR